jgi:TNF receptor-associated protein 1
VVLLTMTMQRQSCLRCDTPTDAERRSVVKHLLDKQTNAPEEYSKFYDEFGTFIKEGVITEADQRAELSKLLHFESSTLEADSKTTLSAYVSRIKPKQKDIFYLVAPNRDAALRSPYYEAFHSAGVEVLFMYEPVDDFVANHVNTFDGHRLLSIETSVAAAVVKDLLPQSSGDQLPAEQVESLCNWLKSALGDKAVSKVSSTDRLTDSPAVVVDHLSASLRRFMKTMDRKQGFGEEAVQLEINPKHALVKLLESVRHTDEALAKEVAQQVRAVSCCPC